ncbi:MAG: hypothetical protein ABJH98_05130 [Reichenbachiella sp.]|uniref:hypothetical protein n=1 Tax=Reichenbachiella sp. TaxID=2184521 RepID=UPI0032988E19
MQKSITAVIEKYISEITSDEFHRYKSWDNCYKAFSTSNSTDTKTLELAFYLASWGMYRGSSGLLQKNHLIHQGAVDIILSSQKLRCSKNREISKANIEAVLELKSKLAKHYKSISFTKGSGESKPISPTDTLLSKIMLGTLGCVPAYDRYFIDGLKEMKMKHKSFNQDSLNQLYNFIEDNKTEIIDAQKLIKDKTKSHYPVMKILDMYFWQIGYDKEVAEKIRKGK